MRMLESIPLTVICCKLSYVMENFPGINPDFSSLAEKPKDSDDDSKEKKGKKQSKKEKRPSIFERDKEPEKTDEDKFEQKEQEHKKVPLEKLADDEKSLVVSEYVDARSAEVSDELQDTTPKSPDEAAVLANAAFLENLQEKLDDAEPASDDILDEAVAETIAELGLDDVDTEDQPEPDENPAEHESESELESEPTDLLENAEPDLYAEELDPEEDDPTATRTSPIPTPTPSIPPLPPLPPIPSGPGGSSTSHGGGPSIPPFSPPNIGGNTSPAPAFGNLAPVQPTESRAEGWSARKSLLVGGVLGYLIGRRRGRIKTEKKLLPIQNKLEKEVVDLQQKIAIREEKIRKLASEQVTQQPQLKEQIVERLLTRTERKTKTSEQEQRLPRTEKFGKIAVLAERPSNKESTNRTETPLPPELMTIAELLTVAERVPIENSNVKKLYETGRLDQVGLRRVMRAYLRGERFERVASDNLIAADKLSSHETLRKETPETSQYEDNESSESFDAAPHPASQLEQMIAKASVDIKESSGLHVFDQPKNQPAKQTAKPVVIAGALAVVVLLVVYLMTS